MKRILILVLSVFVSFTIMADDVPEAFSQLFGFVKSTTCPFSNPAYKDVRDFATTLEQSLKLPPKCMQTEEHLRELGQDVSKSVNALVDFNNQQFNPANPNPSPLNYQEQSKGERLAGTVMNSLTMLAQAFQKYSEQDDECARALQQKPDYVGRILDTVSGIVPMAAAFSGPLAAPIAMGVRAILASVSSIWKMYHNQKYRMWRPEERRAFLSQSCAFFQLDQNIRWIERHKMGETNTVTQILNGSFKALDVFASKAPPSPKPLEKVASASKLLETADKRFLEFSNFLPFESRISADGLKIGIGLNAYKTMVPGFFCHVVQESFRNPSTNPNLAQQIITELEDMLKEDEEVGIDIAGKKSLLNFFVKLNAAPDWKCFAEDTDLKLADEKAKNWMEVFHLVLQVAGQEIQRLGRMDLSCLPEFKARQEYEKQLVYIQTWKSEMTNLITYLNKLAEPGHEFEMAELLDSRDRISDLLFNRAATSWLSYYNEMGIEALEKFNERQDEIDKYIRLSPPTVHGEIIITSTTPGVSTTTALGMKAHPACLLFEETSMNWINAKRHLQAANTYCLSFKHILNSPQYENAARQCFSSADRRGTLNALAQKVDASQERFDQISNWLETFACRFGKKFADKWAQEMKTEQTDPKTKVVIPNSETNSSDSTLKEPGVGLCKAVPVPSQEK